MIIKTIMRLNFNLKKRIKIYRILSKATNELHQGVKIKTALEHLMVLEKKANDDKTLIYKMFKLWIKELTQGREFGQIINDFVPHSEAMIISFSETSGKISDGFALAAQIAKSQANFINAFRNALIAPLVTLTIAFLTLSFFCNGVLPGIANALKVEQLSNFSLIVLHITKSFNVWFPLSIWLFFSLIFFVIWALPNYKAGFRLKLEKFPPFSLYRLVIGCSFLHAFNALTKSGVPQVKTLHRMAKFASPYLKYRIDKILYFMNRGMTFGHALISTRLNFPDKETIDELSMYLESGNMDSAIDMVINNLNEDGFELITIQAKIAQYICTGIIVLVIVFLLFSLFSLVEDMQAVSMI